MAISPFSPLTPRFCAWCQTPLQGRSDKKCCSPQCRSQIQRHGVPAGPIDWPAQLAAAEARTQELQRQLDQQAQAQQAARPFDDLYDQLPRLVGLLARSLDEEKQIATHLGLVDHLLGQYQQHPGLVTGEGSAQQRLLVLQQVRADLADQQQNLITLRQYKQSWQPPTTPQLAAPSAALPDREAPEPLVPPAQDASLA